MTSRRLQFRTRYGFSLVELMVVVGIIGILTMIGLSNLQEYQRRAYDVRSVRALNLAVKEVEALASEHGSYGGVLKYSNSQRAPVTYIAAWFVRHPVPGTPVDAVSRAMFPETFQLTNSDPKLGIRISIYEDSYSILTYHCSGSLAGPPGSRKTFQVNSTINDGEMQNFHLGTGCNSGGADSGDGGDSGDK